MLPTQTSSASLHAIWILPFPSALLPALALQADETTGKLWSVYQHHTESFPREYHAAHWGQGLSENDKMLVTVHTII